MIESKKLGEFFENLEKLPRSDKVALARNRALFENADFNVILALMKCIPDDTYVSKKDYQNLLFVASVRCELGHLNEVYPSNAVASAISKMQGGDVKFSDLLMQDTATGRVYPMMRRYLSMYKAPIDTLVLYYNLSTWDEPSDNEGKDGKYYPVRYRWAIAWSIANKRTATA